MEILRIIVEMFGQILGMWFGYDGVIERPDDLEDDDESDGNP